PVGWGRRTRDRCSTIGLRVRRLPTQTTLGSPELALERPCAVGFDLRDLDRGAVQHPQAIASPSHAVGLLQRAALDLDGLLDPTPDDRPRVFLGARTLIEPKRELGDAPDP